MGAYVFLIPLFILGLGFVCGRLAERNHYRSIREREDAWAGAPTLTMEKVPFPTAVTRVELVRGSACISFDHWKRLMSGFRMFFGGEMHSYASLIDRARREALLRMKADCPDADLFLNTRVETSSIGGNGSRRKQKTAGCVEVLAYSTAVWLDDSREVVLESAGASGSTGHEAGSQATS